MPLAPKQEHTRALRRSTSMDQSLVAKIVVDWLTAEEAVVLARWLQGVCVAVASREPSEHNQCLHAQICPTTTAEDARCSIHQFGGYA